MPNHFHTIAKKTTGYVTRCPGQLEEFMAFQKIKIRDWSVHPR